MEGSFRRKSLVKTARRNLAMCLLLYRRMDHIPASRLMQLCAEAIVQDENEAQHLRGCLECRILLRKFSEDRSKALLKKNSGNNEDGSKLTKSA